MRDPFDPDDGAPRQLGFFVAADRVRKRTRFRSDLPATFGDCQRAEVERVLELRRRWLPIAPAPCMFRCPHNLLLDFPNAADYDGETCVLRIAEVEHSVEEIAERCGVSVALIKNIAAKASAQMRGDERMRAAFGELEHSDHSPERRLMSILDRPRGWREIAAVLNIEGAEAERISEILRGMVRRGEVVRTDGTYQRAEEP